MKPGLVGEAGRHQAEAADRLDADGNAELRRPPVESEALDSSEHRGHDDRTGMNRTALERVVEILAMRRRAVDQRGASAVARPRIADHRAAAVAIDPVTRGAHIVAAACGEAEPDD